MELPKPAEDISGDEFFKVMELSVIEKDCFKSCRGPALNPRTVYGGELMAQGLMAASKTLPDGFTVHSMNCSFLGKSSPSVNNAYRVQRHFDSRSFSHRTVDAFSLTEDGLADTSSPAFFRLECSAKAPEYDAANFVGPHPNVPPVEEIASTEEVVKKYKNMLLSDVSKERLKTMSYFNKVSPMEMRICEPKSLLGLEVNESGRLHAWMRLKPSKLLSFDATKYRDATLAYFSDALLLWVNLTEPRPIHFMVTLSQNIWFHNPQIVPGTCDWILMETRSQYVGDTLTLSFGSMWDSEGNLLASMSQQGLLRTTLLTPVASEVKMSQQQQTPPNDHNSGTSNGYQAHNKPNDRPIFQ